MAAGQAGTFVNNGRPHLQQIPPVMNGQTIQVQAIQNIINPGQLFTAPAAEADVIRVQHKDKFTEK